MKTRRTLHAALRVLACLAFLIGSTRAGVFAAEWTDPRDSTVAGTDVLSGSATAFEGMLDLRLRFAAEPFPVDRTSGIGWCLDTDQDFSTGMACGGSTYLGADASIALEGRPGAISTCDFILTASRGTADTNVVLDLRSSLWYDPATFTLRVVVPLAAVSDLGTPFHYAVTVSSGGFTGGDLAPDYVGFAFNTPGGFFTSDEGPFLPFAGSLWCNRAFESVDIDIEPKNPQNVMRLRGAVEVAVLSTAAFDATSLEANTARFGASGTEAAPLDWSQEDIDGDGDEDLVLSFDASQTGIQCGDGTATLTAYRGVYAVRGTASIRTVGCH